jgi:hypothetical protein
MHSKGASATVYETHVHTLLASRVQSLVQCKPPGIGKLNILPLFCCSKRIFVLRAEGKKPEAQKPAAQQITSPEAPHNGNRRRRSSSSGGIRCGLQRAGIRR